MASPLIWFIKFFLHLVNVGSDLQQYFPSDSEIYVLILFILCSSHEVVKIDGDARGTGTWNLMVATVD